MANIPLYVYATSLSIHLLWILGLLPYLATVDIAAVNRGVHTSFQISVFIFFGQYPGMEFLDCIVILYLIFLGISALFS